jgi:Zn-dependent protease with chaperone function
MTSFFEHQAQARRATQLLIVLMTLCVSLTGVAIYMLTLVVLKSLWAHDHTLVGFRDGWYHPDLFALCTLGTFLFVGTASAVRIWSLRRGGRAVAELTGGRGVAPEPADPLERRLLNVVEEMAIASRVPIPPTFVIDEEDGINAFAAGFTVDDAVIVVTRGCLEKLTRSELQGVVAHEFSHILNGDMRLNMRLMGVVFGLICIALLGRALLELGSLRSVKRYSDDKRENENSLSSALSAVGLSLWLLGSVGELLGQLVKAAVSRQREFLADASAVQFTRDPQGLVGALLKIGGWKAGSQVSGRGATEASHFFFGEPRKRRWSWDPLATHPPLRQRIARWQHGFLGDYPSVGPGIAEPHHHSAV